MIEEWYMYVLNKKKCTDNILDKFLSSDIKESLWTEDYEGCYQYWRFRTTACDSSPEGDISKIESINYIGDKWYEIKYLDMGWKGLTKIKVDNAKITEYVADKSWDSWDNANEQSVTEKTNSQQEFTEESMKRVNEIQRIMENINKVYNAYRNGTSTGVNAMATISDYRIEGDMLFKELMSLARKYGNKEALEAFQQEKEDFDNTSYRMEQSINASMY